MSAERKFLLGIVVIVIIVCALLFIANIIMNLIIKGFGVVIVFIILMIALGYPIGHFLEKKIK